ncbi:MAG TPA: PIG-L family deacetylase [Ktedonobacterales bacterium]|nr:PIG-L family deacetylase [Ktedonobacterales bacterium]
MSLYPMTTDRPSRLLCVFAHPDDEVFCVGGTVARWVVAGGEAMILSATRGEAGQIQDARAATRRTLGAVREHELRLACDQLGVQWVECLDYLDGTLRDVGVMTLARDVAARIDDFRPDVVVTFGLDGGYEHPDHIAISAATTLACQLVARRDGRAPHLYYSAFPRQHQLICHSLANWLTERGASFRGTSSFVRGFTLLAEEATLMRYADDAVETQWFPEGFSIVEQGEQASSLYLIVTGSVEAVREEDDGTRHALRRLGPGQFFGERALAQHTPHEASMVATDTVTCLVLSSQEPSAFAGRGGDARLGGVSVGESDGSRPEFERLVGVDISAQIDRKIAALAAHRSQFSIDPAMFPLALVRDLLASEYFERVTIAAPISAQVA